MRLLSRYVHVCSVSEAQNKRSARGHQPVACLEQGTSRDACYGRAQKRSSSWFCASSNNAKQHDRSSRTRIQHAVGCCCCLWCTAVCRLAGHESTAPALTAAATVWRRDGGYERACRGMRGYISRDRSKAIFSLSSLSLPWPACVRRALRGGLNHGDACHVTT